MFNELLGPNASCFHFINPPFFNSQQWLIVLITLWIYITFTFTNYILNYKLNLQLFHLSKHNFSCFLPMHCSSNCQRGEKEVILRVWTWWGLSYPSRLPTKLRTCQRLQYRAERVHCVCVFTQLSAHTQSFYIISVPEMHSFTISLIGVCGLCSFFVISFHLFEVKIWMVIIIITVLDFSLAPWNVL